MRNRRATHRVSLAVSLLLLAGTAGACSRDSSGDGDATTTTAADVTTTTALTGILTPIESVIAGQCLDELPDPGQQPFAVLVIPCEDSHTYEVYAQAQIDMGSPTPPGTPYPGGNAVANAAENQCFTAFGEFMGVKWEESEYDIQTWWPSGPSWTNKKDRTILCAVYRVTGGRTKGSVRGSEQ